MTITKPLPDVGNFGRGIQVPSASTPEMTRDELHASESIIERGRKTFIEVGTELLKVRDGRGWRFEYKSFEAYCAGRWGWTPGRASQMISAASFAKDMEKFTQVNSPIPDERHARELQKLTPKQAIEVLETHDLNKTTVAELETIVREYKEAEHVGIPTEPVRSPLPNESVEDLDAPPPAQPYKPPTPVRELKPERPETVKRDWSNHALACREDETQQLHDILELYIRGKRFDLDPTYSEGKLWDGLPKPARRGDLCPQVQGCEKMDICALPLKDASVDSVFVDLPWVLKDTRRNGAHLGTIETRFTGFKNWGELENTYRGGLAEVERVLVPNGVTVWKVGNQISSSKFFALSADLVIWARELGFELLSEVIVYKASAEMSPNMWEQQNFRQNHVYYFVFRKPK